MRSQPASAWSKQPRAPDSGEGDAGAAKGAGRGASDRNGAEERQAGAALPEETKGNRCKKKKKKNPRAPTAALSLAEEGTDTASTRTRDRSPIRWSLTQPQAQRHFVPGPQRGAALFSLSGRWEGRPPPNRKTL